jgi:hypothetical protein
MAFDNVTADVALRREHPSLVVYKHALYDEIRTGADWEWWHVGGMDLSRLPGKAAGPRC